MMRRSFEVLFGAGLLATSVQAVNNGLGITPQMGWVSFFSASIRLRI